MNNLLIYSPADQFEKKQPAAAMALGPLLVAQKKALGSGPCE